MDQQVTSRAEASELRDGLLMALTVSSGIIDAASFLALGKVFTAFMTGNIAFLGLRLAGAPGPDLPAVIGSLLAFGAGVYVASKIVRARTSFSPPQWRQIAVALGLSMVPQAAFAVLWTGSAQPLSNTITCWLLGLWALAMGMQSAAVRRLHVAGVSTTAATATIICFVGGLAAWPSEPGENKRWAGVILSLLAGATCGGLLVIHARPYTPLVPLVITAGVCLVAARRVQRSP